MPNRNNQQYKDDLVFGEEGEKWSKPHLEKIFGKLKKTEEPFNCMDFHNSNYLIELKSRRYRHNQFDYKGGIWFNHSKIEKLNPNEKRKVIFAFNCEDGLYYWELSDKYTIGMGGRTDRDCVEIRKMAKILSRDMITIMEKPNIYNTFLLDSSDDDD
jgi:hypothetical protein